MSGHEDTVGVINVRFKRTSGKEAGVRTLLTIRECEAAGPADCRPARELSRAYAARVTPVRDSVEGTLREIADTVSEDVYKALLHWKDYRRVSVFVHTEDLMDAVRLARLDAEETRQ